MGFFIIALALFALLVALIAVFSRSATHETWRPTAGFPFALGPAQLHELARAILTSRSLRIEREDQRESGGSDLVAADPTPLLGGRVYVRTLPGMAPAGSAEVQSALEQARAEGWSKVLLISPHGFSDEAMTAASDSMIELVDGPRLLELSRGAVDMNALRGGRIEPRPETTLRAQQLESTGPQAPM